MYSLLPGGLEALPAFDDKDFKLPSEARTVGCFGVTRTLETESDDSETDSPRHHKNGETAVRSLSEIVNKFSQIWRYLYQVICVQCFLSMNRCTHSLLMGGPSCHKDDGGTWRLPLGNTALLDCG